VYIAHYNSSLLSPSSSLFIFSMLSPPPLSTFFTYTTLFRSQAHDFIYSGYWESQIEEMKEKYIPMSETHVITNQTKIIGFISMVEGYLAALFIDVAYQNNGAGKELLNFEKRRRNKIRLK